MLCSIRMVSINTALQVVESGKLDDQLIIARIFIAICFN